MELTVVDAFTDRPFAGNPAAVCVTGSFPEDERMQMVAREMNLSETAFVVARPDGSYDLRWFTPTVEVDLCGHATLASAHVLGGAARFHTRSGELMCTPADELEVQSPESELTAAAAGALGVPGKVADVMTGRSDILVELGDAAAIRGLRPDFGAVADLPARGVIVTAAGDVAGIDCVSRMFAPRVGIAEDPVTGSAHCSLAVFWGERLGRDTLVGEQASARGGIVRMRRAGERVVLGGRAVTMSRVELLA